MGRMSDQVFVGIPSEPFLSLYERTYGDPMPREVFDWKYLSHPHGEAVIWTTSAPEGSWVGAMALQPRRYRQGGKTLLAGQLVDLMVDPDHRRKGIFSAILQRVLDEHRRYGFDLVFTIPAAEGQSIAGFRSVPFLTEIGGLRSYRRFWRARGQLARRLKSDWLASAVDPLLRLWLTTRDRIQAEALPLQVDALFALDQDGLMVDESWVTWRLRSPRRRMQSVAWEGGGAVLAFEKRTAILYALGLGRHQEGALRALLRHIGDSRVDVLRLDAHVSPELETLLYRAGFFRARGPAPLRCFAGGGDTDSGSRLAGAAVHVCRGDLDVP